MLVNKRLLFILFCISFLCIQELQAQEESFTISGFVKDQKTGEALIGATIYIPTQGTGCSTNYYGFFSIEIYNDTTEVVVRMIGYQKKSTTFSHHSSKKNIKIDLESSDRELDEVLIVGERDAVTSEQINSNYISRAKIQEMASLGGESDIMKAIQLLPGAQQGNDGSSGLHVRGGSPDQNLILLDGVPVYNTNHLFGFLSVFNTFSIKDARFFKSSIPARYGGRLSSVIDISLKEGNQKKKEGHFVMSPIASSFNFEAPIKKDTSSFIISLRRSWFDVLTSLVQVSDNSLMTYNFYDGSIKYNHQINKRNKIYWSIYGSRDKYLYTFKETDYENKNTFDWGNITSVVRWNKQIGNKGFLNTSLHYSKYLFSKEDQMISSELDKAYFQKSESYIREWSLKEDVDVYWSNKHQIRTGMEINVQKFKPESFVITDTDTTTRVSSNQINESLNLFYYLEDEWEPIHKLKINYGLRLSLYDAGTSNYFFIEPRFTGSYQLSKKLIFNAGYSKMSQYLHLLTNSTLGQPTDLWVASTSIVKPQSSDQFNIGIHTKILKDFKITIEAYYKEMDNLIAYKDGAEYIYQLDQQWENKVTTGNGHAKGIEILIEKEMGKINGSLGYTFSKTNRQFHDINRGKEFPYKYDRTHDLSVFINYQIKQNKKFNAVFVYNTGHAITVPRASYSGIHLPPWEHIDSSENFDNRLLFDERNNQRIPSYHRLDVSYSTSKVIRKNKRRTWVISVYNLYNRQNATAIFVKKGKTYSFTMFPIFPSLTYQLDF